ncbi:hypothetical protein [Vagococcus fessus]|uniref:Uncharacterized protein n=1 Tax=Vagococcus fessus TaxID=120370 RepID=A0A430A8K5_9ENTE|nr:hypothetical protein [Vagococcus fessus]RSU03401.1 hypothetical protein CBF31_06730 [Vagococcus fessus]
MKKYILVIMSIIMVTVLSACTSDATPNDLMENEWHSTINNDGIDLEVQFSFKEDKVKITPELKSIDMDKMPADAKTLGKEFAESMAKTIVSQLKTTADYSLKEGKISIAEESLGIDGRYPIKKEGENMIIESEGQRLVLEPIKK